MAAAGALVMASGAVMLNAPTASAAGKTGGNNGTVKVQDVDLDGHANDPKLPCQFDITWSGFDADPDSVDATVTFALQNPTSTTAGYSFAGEPTLTDTVTVTGGRQTKSYTLPISGPPTNRYHVDIAVSTPRANGSVLKGKTFWVDDCAAMPPSAVTPKDPTVVPGNCDGTAGYFTVPATTGVDYLLDGSQDVLIPGVEYSTPIEGTILAAASDGYILATTSQHWAVDYSLAATHCSSVGGDSGPGGNGDSGGAHNGGGQGRHRTAVTPLEPIWVEAGCSSAPEVQYQPVTGVRYSSDIASPKAGDTVKVTAQVTNKKLYYFTKRTITWWRHHFGSIPSSCGDIPVNGGGNTGGNIGGTPGSDNAGDVVTVTPLYPTAKAATCEKAGSLVVPTQPQGVLVKQTGSGPGDVTFTFAPATGYTFPAGTETTLTVTVAAKKTGSTCGDVLGVETTGPKSGTGSEVSPDEVVVVEASPVAVPTAVDAGLETWPTVTATNGLLAQGLVGGGLLLVMAGGWIGLGRRTRGAREF